jgi:hypothetical protein
MSGQREGERSELTESPSSSSMSERRSPPPDLNLRASTIAVWKTFTTLVPSAADTKKNGKLFFAANLKFFLVT